MKRMLDQKTIDELQELLENVVVSEKDGTITISKALIVGSDAYLNRVVVPNGLEDFVNEDEELLFPNGVPTKLYKHSLVVVDTDEYEVYIDIVSTTSSSITTLAEMKTAFETLHNSFVSHSNFNYGVIFDISTTIDYYDYQEGVINVSSVSITDTITEL